MGVTETGAPSRGAGRVVAVGLAGAVLGTVLTLALAGTGDEGVSAPQGPSAPVAVEPTTVDGSTETSAPTSTGAPPTTAAAAPAVDPPVAPSPSAPASVPPTSAGPGTIPGTISAEQAGQIAAAHVGGTVDSVYADDDYGAAWDVDVYAPDGEYTIYVSSSGEVVRVDGPYRG